MRQIGETSVSAAFRAGVGGRIRAGGARSRAAFEELLGIDGPGTPYAVEAIAWVAGKVKLGVRCGSGPKPVTFTIARRDDESRGVFETEHLVISHGRGNPARGFIERLKGPGRDRIARYDVDGLSALLAEDPELGKPGLPVPQTDDNAERPRSLLDTWGDATDSWADFFATDEVARGQLDSLDPTSLFVMVQHGDAECDHVNPHGIAPITWLVSYPWEHRIRSDRAPEASILMDADFPEVMLATDLRETDVIHGNPERLRGVLDHAAEVSNRVGKSLFVANTCTPVVTGEDVQSEFDRCRGCTKKPAFYLTVTPSSMDNVFEDILVKHRLAAEAASEPARPTTVNLVGFHETSDTEELIALLGAAGVGVNVVLLPKLTYELVERLPRGAVNVAQPSATWQHLYEQLAIDTKIPGIEPPAPYGFTGTRRWLREVAAAVGLDVDGALADDGAWARLAEPWQARWDAARERAARHRLGIVLRAGELHYLTDARSTWGVPLIALLEEMGFGLDLLVMLEDREEAARAAATIRGTFRAPDADRRHTVKGFNTWELLQQRLGESPCEAVLTYHTFDWRVTQAGKNLFSLQHFELGLGGAVRTAERLSNLCETPFFRRYARYLKRGRDGSRLEATPR